MKTKLFWILFLLLLLSACTKSPEQASSEPVVPEGSSEEISEEEPVIEEEEPVKEEEEPMEGGTTTRVDSDAPKSIASKDITSFKADFFLANRQNVEGGQSFDFVISEDGTVTEKILGVSTEAGPELTAALQDIIDRYDLVRDNGLYDVTAGLPPEYQPRGLDVMYASGERLNFLTNNNPYAQWAEEMYDVLAAWFAERGDESLYPAPETSQITRFNFRYMHDNAWYDYDVTSADYYLPGASADAYVFARNIYAADTMETIDVAIAPLPEDFYEQLTKIITGGDFMRRYDFSYYDHEADNYGNHDEGYYGMGSKTTADHEPDSEDMYLDIYIEFESGHRMNVETRKESEIEGFQPLLKDLFTYFDSLFEGKEETK